MCLCAPRPRLAKRRWMKNIVINPETDFSLPKKPIFKSCQLRFLVATIFSNVSIGISMEMDFFLFHLCVCCDVIDASADFTFIKIDHYLAAFKKDMENPNSKDEANSQFIV